MNPSWTSKHFWDTTNEAETSVAAEVFRNYIEHGHVAYKLDSRGRRGAVMRTFDPAAGRMMFGVRRTRYDVIRSRET